jgi:argininosuccinate lyase
MTGALATCRFERERLEAALRGGHLCATDLADALVCAGVPFREAHHAVGQLVRVAESRGVELQDLEAEVLTAAHPRFASVDTREALDPRRAVERRALVGGPARARVVLAIAEARDRWGAGVGTE